MTRQSKLIVLIAYLLILAVVILSYRSFAEYIRRVQNIGQYSRITEFKLVPDAGQLKGTFTVELYSLPVKNAK